MGKKRLFMWMLYGELRNNPMCSLWIVISCNKEAELNIFWYHRAEAKADLNVIFLLIFVPEKTSLVSQYSEEILLVCQIFTFGAWGMREEDLICVNAHVSYKNDQTPAGSSLKDGVAVWNPCDQLSFWTECSVVVDWSGSTSQNSINPPPLFQVGLGPMKNLKVPIQ